MENNNLTWNNIESEVENTSPWDDLSVDDNNKSGSFFPVDEPITEIEPTVWGDNDNPISETIETINNLNNLNQNTDLNNNKGLNYYVGRRIVNTFNINTYNIIVNLNQIESELKTQIQLTPRKNSNTIFDFNPSQTSETGKLIENIVQIGISKNLKIQDCYVCMLSESIYDIFSNESTDNFIFPISNNGEFNLNLKNQFTSKTQIISSLSPSLLDIFPGGGEYTLVNNNQTSNLIAICGNYQ